MKKVAVLLACVACLLPVAGGAVPYPQTQAPASPQLADAQQKYQEGKYAEAEKICDQALIQLRAAEPLDEGRRQQLAQWYELRARARYGKNPSDLASVRKDFASLFEAVPSYQLEGPVNPVVGRTFATVKGETVGTIRLQVTPADAEVRLGSGPIDMGAQPVEKELFAASYTVSARKPGFRDFENAVLVTAGNVTDVPIVLERLSSTLLITTEPADVQVVLDNAPKGTTEAGPSGAGSGVLKISDVASGTRHLEFSKACYLSATRTVSIPQPDDVVVPVVQLARAVASVTIQGSAGTVFVDGEPRGELRGAAPLAIDICAGKRVVEVRTDHSRFVTRPDLKAGVPLEIRSELRPAVAILSAAGVPNGYLGDLRIEVEDLLHAATGLTVFAPPLDSAQDAMRQLQLQTGWLAFDAANRPIGTYQAVSISATQRSELSATLASRFGAQGVAEITVPSPQEPRKILLTLLAAGSGEPEVVPLDLDDNDSIRNVLARFSARPPLFELSAGVQVADVRDVSGTVVVRQLWTEAGKPSFAPGDVIVAADGKAIGNRAALVAYLSTKKAGESVVLDARSAGGNRRVDAPLVAMPRLIGLYDETLLVNRLVIAFRFALRQATTPDEQAFARLNLAVALMKFGNWTEAKAELDKVALPDRPGVAGGTVKYLLGVCLDGLGRAPEADEAYRAAKASNGALLSSDGPPIRELADAKLNDPSRKR